MAPMGENFRGGKEHVTCPLCNSALDNQAHSFQCEAITKRLEINCDMEDIYTQQISLETAETVTKTLAIREEILEEAKRNLYHMDGNQEEHEGCNKKLPRGPSAPVWALLSFICITLLSIM